MVKASGGNSVRLMRHAHRYGRHDGFGVVSTAVEMRPAIDGSADKLRSLSLQFTFIYGSLPGMGKSPPDRAGAAQTSALAEDLRLLIGTLKRRLREQGQGQDLPPSQVAVLLRLERDGPATVSNLARSEGMRPQSMSAAIAALEAAGLVRGAPDPSDGRQTIMSLTDACRERLRTGRAARQDWLSRTIAARLAPQEQQELATAVRLLKRLVDD